MTAGTVGGIARLLGSLEPVSAEVPHRQFVFTIPQRLRIYLRFDRRLLGDLCRAAARTVITVWRDNTG